MIFLYFFNFFLFRLSPLFLCPHLLFSRLTSIFKIFIWLRTSSVVVVYRRSGPLVCGILVPRPGIEPASPALGGWFLITGPSGNSWDSLQFCLCLSIATILRYTLRLHSHWWKPLWGRKQVPGFCSTSPLCLCSAPHTEGKNQITIIQIICGQKTSAPPGQMRFFTCLTKMLGLSDLLTDAQLYHCLYYRLLFIWSHMEASGLLHPWAFLSALEKFQIYNLNFSLTLNLLSCQGRDGKWVRKTS